MVLTVGMESQWNWLLQFICKGHFLEMLIYNCPKFSKLLLPWAMLCVSLLVGNI